MSSHAGFDLNATLTEAVVKTTRQIRAELQELGAKSDSRGMANGLSASDGKAS